MWELVEQTGYEGHRTLAYFESEYDVYHAKDFLTDQDNLRFKYLKPEDRDWGYEVREVKPMALVEFKRLWRYQGSVEQEYKQMVGFEAIGPNGV